VRSAQTVEAPSAHSARGGLQTQVEEEQTSPAMQTFPQAPQLEALEEVFTQVSRVGSPFGQRTMGGDGASQVHAAPEQVPSPQEWPQAPQFAASVCTFTHENAQLTGLSGGQAQNPAEHPAPASQVMLHSPQWRGSVVRSTQLPPQAV